MQSDKQKIAELEKRVKALEDFMLSFNSPGTVRPLVKKSLQALVGAIKLSDLSDVENTDGASTGQVLKKTSTTWQPGTDNT